MDEVKLIEAIAHELAAGPASVSRDYRRRLAYRILECCRRLRGEASPAPLCEEDLAHLYVQSTFSTACGVKVWEYPHTADGQDWFGGRPLCFQLFTLRQAEQLLTCRKCIEAVRAEPSLLRQQVIPAPVDQIVLPEYRERFLAYLARTSA